VTGVMLWKALMENIYKY